MNKFLSFFNIKKHWTTILLKNELKKHTKNQKRTFEMKRIINLLILVIFLFGLVYGYYIYNDPKIRLGILILAGSFCIIYFFKILFMNIILKNSSNKIKRITLKDENNKTVESWEIKEKKSLLIGKKNDLNEVDIDLSKTTYSSLISREHAVLNYTGKDWYFEDIGSSNGSGVKSRENKEKFKIEEGRAYKIKKGDTLYIANTKLIIG